MEDTYSGHIAIDLGTTNSVVSRIKPDGEIELIKNADGDYLTPSFVWFDETITEGNNTFIGKKAKEQMNTDPKNVIFGYKPDMGSGKRLKTISLPGMSVVALKAETCSKLVLKYLKKSSEKAIGETVNNVVVTVPARFTDPQRNATQLCCTNVGLQVLKIISEPTAAAYHYGVNSNSDDDVRTILAYDLGGGTFDASVILNMGTDTSVAGTDGNIHLGGDDIDREFAFHLAKSVLPKNIGFSDLPEDIREMFIRRAEQAKVDLCTKYVKLRSDYIEDKDFEKTVIAMVDLTNFGDRLKEYGVKRKSITVNYDDFRKAATYFIEDTISITRKLIENLERENVSDRSCITDILLVGGSSRIPLVREMMMEFIERESIGQTPEKFNAEYFHKYLTDPDLSVSLGAAAYMKAILDGDEYKIADIVPLPIGVGVIDETTNNRRMEVIIARGSMLPTHSMHPKEFTNINAGEEFINVKIYEGVSLDPEENDLLGTIKVPLNTEQQKTAKSARIKVQIGVTKDGIIEASYIDLVNSKRGKLKLNRLVNESGDTKDEVDSTSITAQPTDDKVNALDF